MMCQMCDHADYVDDTPPHPACPFCGNTSLYLERINLSTSAVKCDICGAQGPIHVQHWSDGDEVERYTAEQAWDLWYKRPLASHESRNDKADDTGDQDKGRER